MYIIVYVYIYKFICRYTCICAWVCVGSPQHYTKSWNLKLFLSCDHWEAFDHLFKNHTLSSPLEDAIRVYLCAVQNRFCPEVLDLKCIRHIHWSMNYQYMMTFWLVQHVLWGNNACDLSRTKPACARQWIPCHFVDFFVEDAYESVIKQ